MTVANDEKKEMASLILKIVERQGAAVGEGKKLRRGGGKTALLICSPFLIRDQLRKIQCRTLRKICGGKS